LVLATSAQVAPAAFRHRSRFWKVCSLCASPSRHASRTAFRPTFGD
jgi:hypothetical protein